MADPTAYERDYSFSGWASPTPLPGAALDVEFDNIAQATTDLVEAVKDVRRADGKLKNGSVDYGALDPVLQAALAGPILETDPDFPTRASFILFDHSDYADGTIKRAGDHSYQKLTGATTLADKADWIPLPPYHLAQWGVVTTTDPATVTDQSAKVQAAVTYAANRELHFDGCVGMASVVNIREPLTVTGAGFGDTTSSASGPLNPAAAFVAMTSGMTMFRAVAVTLGERIYGIIMRNFALRGQNLAAKGIYHSSLSDSSFSGIFADRFTSLAIDGDTANNAISSNVRVEDCVYQSGSAAAARASSGVKVDGTDAYGATQYTIRNYRGGVHSWRITAVTDSSGTATFAAQNAETGGVHQIEVGDVVSIYNSRLYKVRDATVTAVPVAGVSFQTGAAYAGNETDARVAIGWALDIGDHDNGAFTQIGGTNLMLRGTRVGKRASRKNTILHVGAHVVADTEAIARIVNINSEPSSVTLFGSPAVQYSVTDRVNGAHYSTRDFVLSDNRFLPISAAILSATGTGTLGGASVPVVTFPDSGTPTATWFFAAPPEWDNGTINAVLHFSGGASGNMYLTTNIATPVLGGGGVGAWDATVTQAVPFAATAGDNTANLALNHTFARGDGVFLQISRDAANGSDTSSAAFTILGVEIVYASGGPNGSGANRFDTPVMRF